MNKLYEGLAEIFEVEVSAINSKTVLSAFESPWDSLAIISTIALVDECYGKMLDGKSLLECESVGDIEQLIGL